MDVTISVAYYDVRDSIFRLCADFAHRCSLYSLFINTHGQTLYVYSPPRLAHRVTKKRVRINDQNSQQKERCIIALEERNLLHSHGALGMASGTKASPSHVDHTVSYGSAAPTSIPIQTMRPTTFAVSDKNTEPKTRNIRDNIIRHIVNNQT